MSNTIQQFKIISHTDPSILERSVNIWMKDNVPLKIEDINLKTDSEVILDPEPKLITNFHFFINYSFSNFTSGTKKTEEQLRQVKIINGTDQEKLTNKINTFLKDNNNLVIRRSSFSVDTEYLVPNDRKSKVTMFSMLFLYSPENA